MKQKEKLKSHWNLIIEGIYMYLKFLLFWGKNFHIKTYKSSCHIWTYPWEDGKLLVTQGLYLGSGYPQGYPEDGWLACMFTNCLPPPMVPSFVYCLGMVALWPPNSWELVNWLDGRLDRWGQVFPRRIPEKSKAPSDLRCPFTTWPSLVLSSLPPGDGVRDENQEERLSPGEEFLDEYREGTVRWFSWIVCIWEPVPGATIPESKFTTESSSSSVASGFLSITFCVVISGKRMLSSIDAGIQSGFSFSCTGSRPMCTRISGLFSTWTSPWGAFKLGLSKST